MGGEVNLAQRNVLEFIQRRGKVTKVDVFAEFDLAGKRVVEQALEELAEARHIVRGANDVFAPARMRKAVEQADEPPPPPPGGQVTERGLQRREMLTAAMARLLAEKGEVRRADMRERLPGVLERDIDNFLFAAARDQRLERVRAGVYRRGRAGYDTATPPANGKAHPHGTRGWDPRRTTNTPSEAKAPAAEARPASIKPAAVATPLPVADGHDEAKRQSTESPPPAMGPAEADADHQEIAPMTKGHYPARPTDVQPPPPPPRAAATPQPAPRPGEQNVVLLVVQDVLEDPIAVAHDDAHMQVLHDFLARSNFGLAKYGTRLFTGNGRDALMDAYQEAIDLVMYLRQAVAEGEDVHPDYRTALGLCLTLQRILAARAATAG